MHLKPGTHWRQSLIQHGRLCWKSTKKSTVSLWPRTHWQQSRPYRQQSWTYHKLSNSRCCRFVAKTGNNVERIRQQSTLLPICCRFRQQSTFNKVDRVEFNFIASVYRASRTSALISVKLSLQPDTSTHNRERRPRIQASVSRDVPAYSPSFRWVLILPTHDGKTQVE